MPTRDIRHAINELTKSAIQNGDCLVTDQKANRLLHLIYDLFIMPDYQRRQIFITERIKTVGIINRANITDTFMVSTPQASLDIQLWIKVNPGQIWYDKSQKCYKRIDK